MSRLTDLLRRLDKQDPELAQELTREYERLSSRRAFGLSFERHVPETVELPHRKIRRGDKVRFRVPRSESGKDLDQRLWKVIGMAGKGGERTAHLMEHRTGEDLETTTRLLEDLIVVAEFRDPIYPGLRGTGNVESGGDKPFHTVIKGENYHALELLTYTHRERLDLIYIDPPYNTGGKFSWLYNDDYVDREDDYRHSKWLAFMERRLRLAQALLKPSGAIMVSIGEDEQHRLRMLMEQVFGPANFVAQLAVEMSTTSGPKTTNAQQGTIVKNLEYVLICRKSAEFDTQIAHTPLYDAVAQWDSHYSLWLNSDGSMSSFYDKLDEIPAIRDEIERLRLVEKRGKRQDRFVGAKGMDVLLLASPVAHSFVQENLNRIGRKDTPPVSATSVCVEIDRWVEHVTQERSYRITRNRNGILQQIYTLDQNYRLSDDYKPRFGRTVIRGDLWRGFHGDMGNVSKEGGIPFANGKKPIRLMFQLFRWANNDPDAVILDFFGGSGSTVHAVANMNNQDGGRRRCIVVTNNELSREQHATAKRAGLRPGDPEWEELGVYETATRPRLLNMATEESANLAFFDLTYEDPDRVRYDLAFSAIAPLLWMQAGSEGRRIDTQTHTFDIADTYAVLFNVDAVAGFIDAVREADRVRIAYIVTDDERQFQLIARELSSAVESIRLYESYLGTYRINTED